MKHCAARLKRPITLPRASARDFRILFAELFTLTWTGAEGLEVEIRRVTEVYQSLRSYKGIHITYRVNTERYAEHR